MRGKMDKYNDIRLWPIASCNAMRSMEPVVCVQL